jgi:hypothetical protein
MTGDSDEPVAPESVPKYLREGVKKQSIEILEDLRDYVTAVIDWKTMEAQRRMEEQAVQRTPQGDSPPDDWDGDPDQWSEALEEAYDEIDISAGKGTITTKEIDGRRYYYLQWREGSDVVSKYIAPVSPAGDE